MRVVKFVAAVGFATGASAIIGYCTGFERMYHWYADTPMALNTAIGFCSVSLGLFILAFKLDKHDRE